MIAIPRADLSSFGWLHRTLAGLATGARWSEAEKLKPTGLRNGVITFSGTKSGKVRSVPITPELEAKIVRHWREHGQPNSAITSFRRALARTTIELPKGQAAYALRYTFASHFIQNGGNILTQQRILSHASLADDYALCALSATSLGGLY
ncbi:hypothetical protein [Aquipseudomonas alcaligenes]|uniref:hypothetical protein n=1 Tax=Aquipseudomonas alcaligenes TaxID=43263 RepID=UPI001F413AD4|nr:hypothetical protein [Pseudomonas alcaligenes]